MSGSKQKNPRSPHKQRIFGCCLRACAVFDRRRKCRSAKSKTKRKKDTQRFEKIRMFHDVVPFYKKLIDTLIQLYFNNCFFQLVRRPPEASRQMCILRKNDAEFAFLQQELVHTAFQQNTVLFTVIVRCRR